jgi:hypothetical protein
MAFEFCNVTELFEGRNPKLKQENPKKIGTISLFKT